MKMSATALLVVTLLLLCIGTSYTTTLQLQGTLRDQAPDYMNHANFPDNYWKYNGWDDDLKQGSCGNANGGNGWSGTDFELPLFMYGTIRTANAKGGVLYNGEPGLVGDVCDSTNQQTCGQIGSDRTPQYRYTGRSPKGSIQSPSSFYNWFHDSPQTVASLYTINLSNQGQANSRTYAFSSNNFFPLDGQGWKDYNIGADKAQHNFGFCLEIHTHFSYQGGEVFNFIGDDDVFVYLNGQLVIDLGGVHTNLSASVNLAHLGLTPGTNYPFDFFYCERHTIASTIMITTTIEFTCNYYDWCGACEGNGQTCCNATALAACSDNNACTTDKCGVNNALDCQHSAITCDDQSSCTDDTCDPVKGCVFTPKVCNDNNACTLDSCNNVTGCAFTNIVCPGDQCNIASCSTSSGCQQTTNTCDDNNACTKDSCDSQKGCAHVASSCDDKNACTTDTCDVVKGCLNTAISCNDSNACTADTCSTTAGCQYQTVNCDDSNACTLDNCDTKTGCTHQPIGCDDHDACTKDTCDKLLGCQNLVIDCNDKNACTQDVCSHTAGCVYTNVTCDDANACTADSCGASSGCSNQKISCDDNNACTQDGCDAVKGCTHTNVSCDDKNACTVDSCDSVSGCKNTPVSCDDNDACTRDTCNTTLGCQHSPLSCDDSNACTTDKCDKTAGCSHDSLICNDNNACTADSCNITKGCVFVNISCDDSNSCTTDSCNVQSGCIHSTLDCNDHDPCTADSCNTASGCAHLSQPCDHCLNGTVGKTCSPLGGNLCFPVDCDPGSGVCNITRQIDCNDHSNCTIDKCTNGVCSFTAVNCDDNNACTIDSCDIVSGCAHRKINCDDQNPCTTDSCNATGQCVNTPNPGLCSVCGTTSCTWTDVCNPKECVNNTCTIVPVNCNDNNLCTTDTCFALNGAAVCSNSPIFCNNSDVCNPQHCDLHTGNCVGTPVVCDDNNACTTESCINVGGVPRCYYIPKSCANDPCNPNSCNTTSGICYGSPVLCDDHNACTQDTCVNLNGTAKCTFTALPCATSDLCNPHSCSSITGVCSGTPVICDDRNPCTIDHCAVVNGTASCIFTPVACNNSDLCNPQRCDVSTGSCLTAPVSCDDGNNCTDDTCVVVAQNVTCVNQLISCDEFDTGGLCVPAKCDPKLGCVADKDICDDNNPCTTDTCVGPLNCSYTFTPLCDDGDACTVDSCDSNQRTLATACKHSNVTCVAPNVCQVVAGCDHVNGCVYTPLQCPPPTDWCQLSVCDNLAGCINIAKSCVVIDPDCYIGSCDSVQQQCVTTQRPDFTTATTQKGGGVTCYVYYNSAQAVGVITGGVIAGIVAGAVVFAVIAGVAGRKAYLISQLRAPVMAAAQSNPLYIPAATSVDNPLYS